MALGKRENRCGVGEILDWLPLVQSMVNGTGRFVEQHRSAQRDAQGDLACRLSPGAREFPHQGLVVLEEH